MPVCIEIRARPSRFSVASREQPRGLCCLVGWPFPTFWRWLSSSLSCFFFALFFLSGYQRARLFSPCSCEYELSVLSVWNTALVSKRCWIFYAMLVCYTLLCYNLYITIRCVLVHSRSQVSGSFFLFSPFQLVVSFVETCCERATRRIWLTSTPDALTALLPCWRLKSRVFLLWSKLMSNAFYMYMWFAADSADCIRSAACSARNVNFMMGWLRRTKNRSNRPETW
jgi:hypothetical protein